MSKEIKPSDLQLDSLSFLKQTSQKKRKLGGMCKQVNEIRTKTLKEEWKREDTRDFQRGSQLVLLFSIPLSPLVW